MFKPSPFPVRIDWCKDANCKCPVTLARRSCIKEGTEFETQTDSFKCGPVAIINALHYCNRGKPGRALRRVIIGTCDTRPKHEDGFNGTKPEKMGKMLQKIWPDSAHFVGKSPCVKAVDQACKSEGGEWIGILLYSYIQKNVQYYHYTTVYIKRHKIYTINDGSESELPWKKNEFIEGHLHLEGEQPILFPQLWVLDP